MVEWKDVKCGFSCISFLWTLVCAVFAIYYLVRAKGDFIDILDSIPDPQIRIVNDGKYWAPIHIICAPSILTKYDTCDDVFDEFDPITSNQMYFSWLYLDVRSPITDTTIDDISSGRSALFGLFAFGIFADILLSKCIKKIYDYNHDYDYEPKVYVIKAVAAVTATLSTTVSHMFLCNLFSISEYSEGLYLLQYVPGWAYSWGYGLTYYIVSSLFVFTFLGELLQSVINAQIILSIMTWNTESYSNYREMGECLKDIMKILLCFTFVLCIVVSILWGISGYGLFAYVWDFNTTFQAIAGDDAIVILQPEYISDINVLKEISIWLGVSSVFCIFDALPNSCK
eukprot:553440_1